MQYMMTEFVRSRETLAVRMMQSIYANDANSIFDERHTREIILQRCVLENDVSSLDKALHRNRRTFDPKFT